MEPMFSEFSYGYALTQELATGKLGPIKGFPIFPSLRQEGRKGGGFDLEMEYQYGAPLFLQFKLSHYLYRTNALEWNIFGEPYYRIYLRPLRHSDQHNLLMVLESNNKDVYYVAPEFHTPDELSEAYMNKQVFDRSVFFSPLDIGNLPDDEYHYVVFVADSLIAYFYSEIEKEITIYRGQQFVENIITRMDKERRKIDENFFDVITDRIVLSLKEMKRKVLKIEEHRKENVTLEDKAQFASYLMRTYFDTELLIIGREMQ